MGRLLCVAVMLAAILITGKPALSQAFPSRPVTIIVPFPAGGPVDTIGRIIAERMRTFLGQPVLIENVGGAAGSIGVGRAARAAPDGYTLSLGNWATHVVNSAIYPLNFDVLSWTPWLTPRSVSGLPIWAWKYFRPTSRRRRC